MKCEASSILALCICILGCSLGSDPQRDPLRIRHAIFHTNDIVGDIQEKSAVIAHASAFCTVTPFQNENAPKMTLLRLEACSEDFSRHAAFLRSAGVCRGEELVCKAKQLEGLPDIIAMLDLARAVCMDGDSEVWVPNRRHDRSKAYALDLSGCQPDVEALDAMLEHPLARQTSAVIVDDATMTTEAWKVLFESTGLNEPGDTFDTISIRRTALDDASRRLVEAYLWPSRSYVFEATGVSSAVTARFAHTQLASISLVDEPRLDDDFAASLARDAASSLRRLAIVRGRLGAKGVKSLEPLLTRALVTSLSLSGAKAPDAALAGAIDALSASPKPLDIRRIDLSGTSAGSKTADAIARGHDDGKLEVSNLCLEQTKVDAQEAGRLLDAIEYSGIERSELFIGDTPAAPEKIERKLRPRHEFLHASYSTHTRECGWPFER